ncbi:hypothetical protein ACL7BL_004370 [Vibrio vulnificus]
MKTELEQAKELREEAREALALAREFNEKSKERQEETTELLKKCRELVGRNNNPPDSVKSRDVFDIVHAINVLDMANTDVLFIFTQFSAHTRAFDAYVQQPESLLKSEPPYPRVFLKTVYLDWDNALERLLSIESQLTELIIEAREAAETKAPEQAEVKA